MKKIVWCLGAVALLGFHAQEARAQVQFGAQASFASEMDFGIGARAMFEAPVENLTIVPTFDLFFPNTGIQGVSTRWLELNGNVHYAFPMEDADASFLPYAGGGLSLVNSSTSFESIGSVSSTDLGLNLLGGVQFTSFGGSFVPFAELRYNTVGLGQLILTGGINF